MKAEDFFQPWERVVEGWGDAVEEIQHVLDLTTAKRELAWRGVTNSAYALHSSLYRRFISESGKPPDEGVVIRFEEVSSRSCAHQMAL